MSLTGWFDAAVLDPWLAMAADLPRWAPVVTATIAVIAVRLSWTHLRETVRINRRGKRADAIFHCNGRYDALYEYKIKIPPLPGADTEDSRSVERDASVRAYFARYWGLKSDEFDYWLADLIDIETFCNWLFSTTQAFIEDRPIVLGQPGTRFSEGWIGVRERDHQLSNPWFFELVDDGLLRIATLVNEGRIRKDRVLPVIIEIMKVAIERSAFFRACLKRGMAIDEYEKTLLHGLGIREYMHVRFPRIHGSQRERVTGKVVPTH